jgi:hypothetical protein
MFGMKLLLTDIDNVKKVKEGQANTFI